MRKIAVLLSCLGSSTVFAHTGVHNDIYHPFIGIDHFLIALITGLFVGVMAYYIYRK